MPRPATDIRERILAAARERFLREGVDGASLRSIAHDAGTSIGMVYYYFKTKDDLFIEVVEAVYGRFLRDMAALLSPQAPPEQRIARLYDYAARLGDDELDVVRLVLREALVSSARLQRVARRFEHGHVPMVMRTLREGVASGRFDAELPPAAMLVATFLLALLPQVLHRQISAAGLPISHLLPTRERAAQALCHVLLQGIGAPRSGSRVRSRARKRAGPIGRGRRKSAGTRA